MCFEGAMVDEIPPERTFVVSVFVGLWLVIEEHTMSCSMAVFVLQIPGEEF